MNELAEKEKDRAEEPADSLEEHAGLGGLLFNTDEVNCMDVIDENLVPLDMLAVQFGSLNTDDGDTSDSADENDPFMKADLDPWMLGGARGPTSRPSTARGKS